MTWHWQRRLTWPSSLVNAFQLPLSHRLELQSTYTRGDTTILRLLNRPIGVSQHHPKQQKDFVEVGVDTFHQTLLRAQPLTILSLFPSPLLFQCRSPSAVSLHSGDSGTAINSEVETANPRIHNSVCFFSQSNFCESPSH